MVFLGHFIKLTKKTFQITGTLFSPSQTRNGRHITTSSTNLQKFSLPSDFVRVEGEQVLCWLLMLRQSGIAVVIVHHTNQDGNEMQGTSRREDAADWPIKISPNFKLAKIAKGTAFTITFTKNREDNGEHEEPMDWTFVTENDRTNVSWKPTDLETLVYEPIKNGMDLNADMAEELGTSKALVSRYAKRFINEYFIKKEGQRYVHSYDQYP
jgi:hypothetical protein